MTDLAEIAARPWSKSSLTSVLQGCGWQWALTKVFGLPSASSPHAAAGTGMHAAIEAHERMRIVHRRSGGTAGAADGLPYEALLAIARASVTSEAAESGDDWARHGVDLAKVLDWTSWCVANWFEHLRPHLMTMTPVAVEPYFRAAGQHGFIDWLGWDPEARTWVVVDHKTAGNFGRWTEGGGGHELEAATYVVGAEVAPNLPPSGPIRMEWHVARRGSPDGRTARWEPARVVARTITANDLAMREAAVKEATRRVLDMDLPTNTAWNLCSAKWCEFYQGCQVDGELHPDRLADTI